MLGATNNKVRKAREADISILDQDIITRTPNDSQTWLDLVITLPLTVLLAGSYSIIRNFY
jgi:hypothetical protein